MNVDQIYRFHRDEAFAKQFTASSYTTFVAMPFRRTDGYDADDIYRYLKEKVHLRADQLGQGLPRSFAPLERASEHKGTALVVTDLITTRILEDHFFVGDLTGNNAGAILETGIALALKPNRRLVLITQDPHDALHFDLKVTYVTRYKPGTLVEIVARALVEAAGLFEEETRHYITQVSASLTSDAISVLNVYGRLWKDPKRGSQKPSIFQKVAGAYNDVFASEIGRVLFEQATRELFAHRLLWTDYRSNVPAGSDSFGHHATELGWRVIEEIWKHDPLMRKPAGAPTGPNSSAGAPLE
jgi:hypothetical protein